MEHNFIRGNGIETMKLIKPLRSRDNSTIDEHLTESTPMNRRNAKSLIQNSKVIPQQNNQRCTPKRYNHSKREEEIYSQLSTNYIDSNSQIGNEDKNAYFIDEQNNATNMQKKGECFNQTYKSKTSTPLRYKKEQFLQNDLVKGSLKRAMSPCPLLHQSQSQQQQKRDEFDIPLFIQKIKEKQMQKRIQDDVCNRGIQDSLNKSKSTAQRKGILTQQNTQNRCNFTSQQQRSENIFNATTTTNLDIQYLIQNAFISKKLVSNENNHYNKNQNLNQNLLQNQMQQINFNSTLDKNNNNNNNNDNNNWKGRLISSIHEKVNQPQSNTILQDQTTSVEDNNLNHQNNKKPCFRIVHNYSKSQTHSKRNSKEDSQQNHISLKTSCSDNQNISQDIPTSQEKQDNLNIFSEQVGFLEILKKFSDNFKNVDKKVHSSTSTKNKDLQNIMTESQNNNNNHKKDNKSSLSNSPLRKHNIITPQSNTFSKGNNSKQQKLEEITQTSNILSPQKSYLAKGCYNSALFYQKFSNQKRIQDHNRSFSQHKQKQMSQHYNQMCYQECMNDTMRLTLKRMNMNNHINDQTTPKNTTSIFAQTSISKIKEMPIPVSNISSVELEPLSLKYNQTLENLIEKQININNYYTNFNQKRKNVTRNDNLNNNNSCIVHFQNKRNNTQNTFTTIQNKTPPKKKGFQYSQVQPQLYRNAEPQLNKIQYHNEQDLKPWEISRNSQLNEIDSYMVNLRNGGEICG